MADTAVIDMEKAQAFGNRMLQMCSDAVLAAMTSIGYETGLFETLAALPEATSEDIATAAGLNERYVREWLSAMTAGGIMEYDPAGRTFRLPQEHAASLTRDAGPNNMAVWAWGMLGVTEAYDLVLQAFRNGGGAPYSAFSKFPKLMAELSAPVRDATLLTEAIPLMPGLAERLEAGIDVADIGCGSGHAVNLMAKAYPNSRFTGYDFSDASLEAARAEAAAMGLTNAHFEARDVATLEGPAKFDFITAFDAIHDQAQPRRVLKGIADLLRDDGYFLCVDVDASSNLEENLENPMAAMMYSISTLHCMTVSLALGGEGLGTMWGDQKARELFAEAGFRSVELHRIEAALGDVHYVCRK